MSDEDSDAGKQGYITYHVMKGTSLPELDISNAKTENSANSTADNQKSIEIYEEFLPILLKQHSSKRYKVYSSFTDAVDEFYSKSEAQKAAKRHNAIEAAAKSKLMKMKKEQEDRIDSLKIQEITSIEKAQAIEANFDSIDKAVW